MQGSFASLEKRFYQIKDNQNTAQCVTLINDFQTFIDQYQHVTDITEQLMLAQALELQLVLNVLIEQRDEAQAIENRLDQEFFGIHRIGKNTNGSSKSKYGTLNIPLKYLDFNRLNQLTTKQKGSTKPKLLGWGINGVGIALVILAGWMFSLQWVWTPLILGIIGVLLITIGSRVNHLINRFMNTIAFETGVIIPGMISQVNNHFYEAVFIAPLNTHKEQKERWGVKKIKLKKAIGTFDVNAPLTAVCVFNQAIGGYYPDFMPTPICTGFSQTLIQYKANSLITENDWERLKHANDQCQQIDHCVIADLKS